MNHDADITEISDHRDITLDDPKPSTPEIRIVKGNPSDAELGALTAVLSGLTAGGGAPGPQEFNPWGHPVDRLRVAVSSWQRITLLERTHMRR